jgi:MFS family permease
MQGLLVLLIGQAIAVMDGSIMAVAAPSLKIDLHASGGELQLIVAIYALAFATLVVTGARLGANLGHRRVFIWGLAAFTGASLVGGLAPSARVLIAARVLQGAAAAVMTPQVLSIIQLQYRGERRARAIGAYSLILAVGVAAGQLVGGLLMSAHLLRAAWRPALLINAPVGAALLLISRRWLPPMAPGDGRRLDLPGVALLSVGLLALVVPLTFGRQDGWPSWIWPSFAAAAGAGWAFVTLERRLRARGAQPLLDLRLLGLPGVGAGVLAVLLIMACYSGFLISLTLYLQGALGFSPLHAGATFVIYASGFATASLTWTRAGAVHRDRLPTLGPLVLGAALLAVGLTSNHHHWQAWLSAPLLFAGGVGHAWGFSPLAARLTTAVQPKAAADMSGFILTASLIGQVLGVAGFTGIYLSQTAQHPQSALAITTVAITAVSLVTAALGKAAVRQRRALASAVTPPIDRPGSAAFRASGPRKARR